MAAQVAQPPQAAGIAPLRLLVDHRVERVPRRTAEERVADGKHVREPVTADGGEARDALRLEEVGERALELHGAGLRYGATTGRRTREGASSSWWTRVWAIRVRVCRPSGSPVFGFTSKRGNDEEETQSPMRCPARKRFAVG